MGNVNTVPESDKFDIQVITFAPNAKENTIEASRPAIVGGGKIPKVSKAEKTIIVKKDGKTIRCKLAEGNKLKKMSVVKKDKIAALDKRFVAKYPEMRKDIEMSVNPEVRRSKIEKHDTGEKRERA